MNRDELVRETAKRTDYTIAVCDEIIREVWEVCRDELVAHGEIRIPRFGKFVVVDISPQEVKMPNGKIAHREAHKAPRFFPSTILREEVRS